ncbi:MAG TPA: hypothetical protein VGD64_16535 [Acidisarcina sp.]
MSSSIETINIAVPVSVVAVAQRAVEAGEYASVSDVVSDALLDWTKNRSPLREHGTEDLREIWQEVLLRNEPGVPSKTHLRPSKVSIKEWSMPRLRSDKRADANNENRVGGCGRNRGVDFGGK